MAKLKTPLMSFGATGTVGQALTVSRWKGLYVAKKVPTHPDARSAAQLAHRQLYSHARDYWHTLTAGERASLLSQARSMNMTGYNLILLRYLSDLLNLEAWWPLHAYHLPAIEDYSLLETDGVNFGAIPAADFCAQAAMALFFDGVNDRVVATCPQLDFTSGNFSLTARIYSDLTVVAGYTVTRGLTNADGYFLLLMDNGAVYFYTNQAAAQQHSRTSFGGIAADTWTTIGLSRSGSSIRLYVNGVDDTAVAAVHIDPLTSARTMKIGARDDLGGQFYKGRICDLKVFSRTLTPAQHLAFHQRYCVHPPR